MGEDRPLYKKIQDEMLQSIMIGSLDSLIPELAKL